MRRPIIAVLGVLGLVTGIVAGPHVWAAVTSTTATCTNAPVVSDTGSGQRITVVCTVPKPAPVTTTVTVPGPTVTVTATPEPSDTPDPAPSETATPDVPSSDPTPTASDTPEPTPTDLPSQTGFPDASSAGVPAGTVLRKVPSEVKSGPGWTWESGGGIRANDGAVLDSLDIAGGIEVYGSNVTISRVKVTAPGYWWAIGVRGGSNVTIKDSTITGAPGVDRTEAAVKDIAGNAEINLYRNDISNWSTAIQISRGVVEGNYVHDPGFRQGDHTNGFTANGGRTDGSLTIRNNTFLNNRDQTDAISLFQDFGIIQNVTVDHNLMAGGSYCLYAGGGSKGMSNHVVIQNNQFSTRYSSKCAAFGPVAGWQAAGVGNVWSNNTWADGPNAGKAVTP